MTVSAQLEAVLATMDGVNIGARTVVARPPSELDSAEDEISVYIGGVEVTRDYDPDVTA